MAAGASGAGRWCPAVWAALSWWFARCAISPSTGLLGAAAAMPVGDMKVSQRRALEGYLFSSDSILKRYATLCWCLHHTAGWKDVHSWWSFHCPAFRERFPAVSFPSTARLRVNDASKPCQVGALQINSQHFSRTTVFLFFLFAQCLVWDYKIAVCVSGAAQMKEIAVPCHI